MNESGFSRDSSSIARQTEIYATNYVIFNEEGLGSVDILGIIALWQQWNYRMTSGGKSFNSCVPARTCMWARKRTADGLWKGFSGSPVAAPSGDCCPKATATGTASTSGLPAGVIKASGNGCITILPRTPIWKISLSTARWYGPIPVLVEHRKKGGQGVQALGRSRGGFSTKIHVSVDALGNPLRFILTGGQSHDITQGPPLIAGYTYEHAIGDRAYDSDDFRQEILDTGGVPVIPPRARRKEPAQYDEYLYRERHLVECFINKIKHYRRIFSRFERLSQSYMGFLHFVGALIWLR